MPQPRFLHTAEQRDREFADSPLEQRRFELSVPPLNASVPRGATWVPRTAPSESRPPEKRHRSAGVSATAPAAATPSSALGVRMLTRRSRCLPACGDFDIEKMRPEWRDEVYQNWRACKAIEAQMAARAKCDSCSWFGLAGEDGCPPGMP